MAKKRIITPSPQIVSQFVDTGGSPLAPVPKGGKTLITPTQKFKGGYPKKSAMNLYGNIYTYPNYGNYRPRFYALQDMESGVDNLSRELLVRWSRECVAQLPFIYSAVRVLAQFAVGNAYLPEYDGEDEEWGKIACDWLKEVWYPQCSTRGSSFDFQNLMFLESTTMDIDGDFLCVYGIKDSMPKVQIIPSHRVRSTSLDGLGNAAGVTGWAQGPLPNTLVADGVVYNYDGTPVGYNVVNYGNLVNSIAADTEAKLISVRDAHLIFDGKYFDKGRGIPSIGSAILQALSIQELDQYLLDKVKLSSMLGYIEATPSGEGPQELETTADLLNLESAQFGVYNPNPNVHAVEIVQGVTNRYIKAEGGDIKMLDSNTPSDETKNYIQRLESQILGCIGVPHSLVFSQGDVSGRISDGVVSIFNAAVERRQKVLDKHGKFMICWALAHAMKEGYIPNNENENLFSVMSLTHPPKMSLNQGYDRKADLDDLAAGVKSLNDITKKDGKTASQVMEEQAKETTELLMKANKISKETGTDVQLVLQLLRENIKAPAPGFAQKSDEPFEKARP